MAMKQHVGLRMTAEELRMVEAHLAWMRQRSPETTWSMAVRDLLRRGAELAEARDAANRKESRR